MFQTVSTPRVALKATAKPPAAPAAEPRPVASLTGMVGGAALGASLPGAFQLWFRNIPLIAAPLAAVATAVAGFSAMNDLARRFSGEKRTSGPVMVVGVAGAAAMSYLVSLPAALTIGASLNLGTLGMLALAGPVVVVGAAIGAMAFMTVSEKLLKG